MLWTHGSPSLTTFLQHINTFHPTINFSHQQSHTSINLLDTTILLTKQRTLQSTLYIKPTDKGLLLHHASHHPTACKKKASFTAKPFDTDVSSPTMTNYGHIFYYNYTKPSWPEATLTPPSLPQSTKPLKKHKANYFNTSHNQPLPVSTFRS